MVSCGVTKTTETRVISPDRNYVATLKVKDCGAVCSPSATVTLHDPQDRLGKGDIEVFDGVGGWPIELHWIDRRTMVIVFCNGSRFKVRSGFLEKQEFWAAGENYPEVKLLVVNDEKVMISGKAYCRFPEPQR